MILEEHTDTGYDGVLHRWRFRVDGKNGKTITFEADVLPDAICEYDLSRKHVHELVLFGMPVPRARPSARWQTQQVHAVLRPRHH